MVTDAILVLSTAALTSLAWWRILVGERRENTRRAERINRYSRDVS